MAWAVRRVQTTSGTSKPILMSEVIDAHGFYDGWMLCYGKTVLKYM
jgi:hypothetical protein